MEGYFPVYKYAELTGLKKDTVLHRANRNSIDCFKNSEGRWFLYYCDDKPFVPDGYLPIKDFCKQVGRSVDCIKKNLDPKYILIQKVPASYVVKGPGRRVYVSKEALSLNIKKPSPFDNLKDSLDEILSRMDTLRPGPQYLTIREWAIRENIDKSNVYNYKRYGFIEFVNNEGHYYIHESYTLNDVKKKKEEIKNGNQK